ncbi:MAG TPA: OstA-like protein, partial [Rubricoccaceae bacterium]|nr:OstA-like protein [Rubricoccaceae bacterium]
MLLLFLSPFLPLSLSQPVRAQPRLVQLVNADSVAVDATSGETVRTLVGNVVLRQDTTTLRADRAVQRVEAGLVTLEGDVRIVTGGDTLTARRVVYDANANEAVAEGDVRIADSSAVLLAPTARHHRLTGVSTFDRGGTLYHDDVTLTAPRGVYDDRTEVATVEGGVELRDSTTVLTSRAGVYDARAERADFAGDVRLRQRDTRLWADSLTHFRETERSLARGRVVLERLGDARTAGDDAAPPDSARRTLLFGARAEHDERAGTSRVTGTPEVDPLLVQLRTDSTGATDTTLVRARRLDALRRDSLAADGLEATFTRVVGVGDVRMAQPRLAAVADSAAFERLEPVEDPARGADTLALVQDRLVLYGPPRPSVWFEGAQVTGDTLVAYALGESVERLEVTGSAFAAQLDSTLGRVRQLAGRRMLALFRDDTLRVLSVWPTAEAITFRATDDGLLAGADRLSADSLAFHFRGGELREITGHR